MKTIKPAPTQLFCQPDEAVTKTPSGFILSEKSVDKPKTAEVINVGSEVREYKPKDRIAYKPYSTSEIKLNDTEYFLVAEEDVLGTIVETSND